MAKSKWTVDAAHSNIDFSTKHMMIATVRGTFHEFSANVEADPHDLTTANIQFDVNLSSVDTRNADRDNHLKSADFFDAENHPTMTFKSTRISKTANDEYDVLGDLTIRGTTKPVTFKVTFEGEGKDPWGNFVAGFSADGKVNRKDFGLVWNVPLETGGVLVSEQVNIHLQIEARQEQAS